MVEWCERSHHQRQADERTVSMLWFITERISFVKANKKQCTINRYYYLLHPAGSTQYSIQSNNRHCNFEAIAVRDIFGMISNNLLELNLYDKYISLFTKKKAPDIHLLGQRNSTSIDGDATADADVGAVDDAMAHEWKTIMHRFLFNLELLWDNGCTGRYSKSVRLSHFHKFYSFAYASMQFTESVKRTQCNEKFGSCFFFFLLSLSSLISYWCLNTRVFRWYDGHQLIQHGYFSFLYFSSLPKFVKNFDAVNEKRKWIT